MVDERLDLDEDDQEELVEFSRAERRLVTQSYDLSITTLMEQWHDETLQLPEIQRQYVWDNRRASRLIESLLLNIPIPVVYFAETEDVEYEVIDGHQRIASIARYLNNEFGLTGLKVLSEFTRKRYHQLPEREQRQIRTRVIRAIIISADSNPTMKFEVFERLNTGSIALNAQEIRNSTHRGTAMETIKLLTLDTSFRGCIGTKTPRRRMVDNELITRFLALRSDWRSYRPPLSRFMNDYMTVANGLSTQELEILSDMFRRTTSALDHIFGPAAFRLTDPGGKPIDRTVNRALAEAQLTSFSWISDGQDIGAAAVQLRKHVADLHAEETFLDSIQRATGDRKRTRKRISRYCDALEAAGLKLSERIPSEQ